MRGRRPWIFMSLACALCVAVIVGLWHREVTVARINPGQLTKEDEVQQALKQDRSATPYRLAIPTGVFVLSFDIVKPNEANVTGYIWQRHRQDRLAGPDEHDEPCGEKTGKPCKARAGIVFPEQVSSSGRFEERYRRVQPGADGQPEVVIGWYFDVTVREYFDYTKYPLDRNDVWLRLWPQDFYKDVVLVPDLSAYDKTGHEDIFGLDRDIVAGTWKVEDTFFSFKGKCYDTRFGIKGFVGQNQFPELHYNIVVSRRFENAFVVALVPLISVLALLFSVLVLATADREKASMLGFSASGAIGASSALLFVVMLAHVSLRREFANVGLVYLEYFYLITYFAVLAVSVNVYLFSVPHRGRLLDLMHRDDNLIPKLAFWPLVLLFLAVVTGVVFGASGEGLSAATNVPGIAACASALPAMLR
jgi:hypothetical protein